MTRPRRSAAAAARAHLLSSSKNEYDDEETTAGRAKRRSVDDDDEEDEEEEQFVMQDDEDASETSDDGHHHPLSSGEEEGTAIAKARPHPPSKKTAPSRVPGPDKEGVPVAYPRVVGRPRKDQGLASIKSSFVEAKAHPLDFWLECTQNAVRIKRASKLSREKSAVLTRPPVDLTWVRATSSARLDSHLSPRHLAALEGSLRLTSERIAMERGEVIRGTFGSCAFEVEPLASTTLEQEAVSFANVGGGGVSAMDFGPNGCGILALSALPEAGVLDHWTQRMEGHAPIQIWRRQGIEVRLLSVIRHSLGLVRGLQFCPVSSSPLTKLILMGLFSDGVLRIFLVDSQQGGTFEVADPVEIDLEDYLITVAQWAPDGRRIAIGSREGHVMLWSLEIDEQGIRPTCVASTRLTNAPITSLAFHDGDQDLLAVGLHDSPAVLVDWRKPDFPAVLYSPLAHVPLVCWSSPHSSWLFADSESSIRGMNCRDLESRHTFAAGTFSGPVLDVALSPLHNIVAAAGADGTLHLSWLDGSSGLILAEQIVLEMRAHVHERRVSYSSKVRVPELLGKTVARPLPALESSISLIRWSRSTESPGVLAVSCAALGILCLMAVDRRVLLKDEH